MAEWNTAFPAWEDFAFPEAGWCLLLAQFYRRSFRWRQVPFSLAPSEVADRIGEAPQPPLPAVEPTRRDSPEWATWNARRLEDLAQHQQALSIWENRKVSESTAWDLEPMPSLEPFSLQPPHLRTFVPVERFETAIRRQSSLVPVLDVKQTARWDPALRAMVSMRETTSRQVSQSSESRIRVSKGQRVISLPDTLCLLVRSEDLLDFLAQADRTSVALVRVRLEVEDGVVVRKPIPGSEVVLIAPGMEILDAVLTQDPLAWPLPELDGMTLPSSLAELEAIIAAGEKATVPLVGTVAGSPPSSRSISLAPPEWWRLANFNAALAGAQASLGNFTYLFQPILPPAGN